MKKNEGNQMGHTKKINKQMVISFWRDLFQGKVAENIYLEVVDNISLEAVENTSLEVVEDFSLKVKFEEIF